MTTRYFVQDPVRRATIDHLCLGVSGNLEWLKRTVWLPLGWYYIYPLLVTSLPFVVPLTPTLDLQKLNLCDALDYGGNTGSTDIDAAI